MPFIFEPASMVEPTSPRRSPLTERDIPSLLLTKIDKQTNVRRRINNNADADPEYEILTFSPYYKRVLDKASKYIMSKPGNKTATANAGLYNSCKQLFVCRPKSQDQLVKIEQKLDARLAAMKKATMLAEMLELETLSCEEVDMEAWFHDRWAEFVPEGYWDSIFSEIVALRLFDDVKEEGLEKGVVFSKPATYLASRVVESGMHVLDMKTRLMNEGYFKPCAHIIAYQRLADVKFWGPKRKLFGC
ncbi:hypothetical protein B7463_g6727, partial [Scytalidium lignicola]